MSSLITDEAVFFKNLYKMLLTVLAGEGSTKSAGHHFRRDRVHSAHLGLRNFGEVPLFHHLVVNISFISYNNYYQYCKYFLHIFSPSLCHSGMPPFLVLPFQHLRTQA